MHLYGIIIEEITNGEEPKISSKTWKLTFKCSYIDEDQEEVVEKKREEFGNIEAKMNLELHEIPNMQHGTDISNTNYNMFSRARGTT